MMALAIKPNCPINVAALRAFLKTKDVTKEELDFDQHSKLKKVAWTETDMSKWLGSPPDVEILYDETHSYLLSVTLRLFRRKTQYLKFSKLKKTFFMELAASNVLIFNHNDDDG